MHKSFYASGFIYHLPSQQILLQQNSASNDSWTLLGEEHEEKETSEEVFKNMLHSLLHLRVKGIYPIYSYLNESTNKNYSLLYATVDTQKKFPANDTLQFRWFSFKDILKLSIPEQVKHDIIVGLRVIEAAGRKERGEHTLQ